MQRTVNLAKTCFKPSSPLLNHPRSKSIATIVTRPISTINVTTPSEPFFATGEAPVIIKHDNALREVIFNSATKSKSLSSEATNIISSQLKVWEDSENSKVIIVKGTPNKTFLTGSDYKEILDLSDNDKAELLKMIQAQYKLFHSIAHLKTAYVAIMDGVTMGEGAALYIHGGIRVATENTRLSIPELSIGITPNAGCNYYMSRLDGQLGTYLILTGQPMSGKDLFFSGLATHYVPSASIKNMEYKLAFINPYYDGVEDVNDTIEKFALSSIELSTDSFLNGTKRNIIDSCFNYDTISEIAAALENHGSEFALETRKIILANSPIASETALKKLRKAKFMTIAECLELDFKTFKNDISNDVKEGAISNAVENTRRNWNSNEAPPVHYLDSILSINNPSLNLPLQNSFKPTRKFTLPTEEDIRRYAVGLTRMKQGFLKPATSFEEIVHHFVAETRGKNGVTEKVQEVLKRKARLVKSKFEGSVVEWNYGF